MWDGNRLLSETRGGRSHLWIYEDDSFAPLAQISLRKGDTEHDAEVYWYHNDVSGMPRELTGAGGEIAWRAEYRAWGNTLRVEHIATRTGEPVYQPLRYQGQYFDAETGLHYNRFRYYDPDAGRFISQDPIGLAGGINLYQYAPNPLVWVDPLGLAFRHVPLTEGVVYRQGSNTPANMTPRPGKDTNPLKKPGLSTTIEKPSGKSIPLDVAKLNEAGFDVIQDDIDHASVRPKGDADLNKLNDWANSRPGIVDGGSGPIHENTNKVRKCIL